MIQHLDCSKPWGCLFSLITFPYVYVLPDEDSAVLQHAAIRKLNFGKAFKVGTVVCSAIIYKAQSFLFICFNQFLNSLKLVRKQNVAFMQNAISRCSRKLQSEGNTKQAWKRITTFNIFYGFLISSCLSLTTAECKVSFLYEITLSY